ncbi:MAG: hypothetical protein SGCHY_000154 [Lobulomycetales sp.]
MVDILLLSSLGSPACPLIQPEKQLNWQRKSVAGFSLDFAWLNFYGFLCYSVFNLAFFFSGVVRDEYEREWPETTNTVQINDVVFSVHAASISGLLVVQTFVYPRVLLEDAASSIRSPQVSAGVKVFIGATAFSAAVLAGGTCHSPDELARADFFIVGHAWLIDSLYFLSYVKMTISFIKYLPQAYLNFRRKSTDGWSIWNIILDLTGGGFSILQQILDSVIAGDGGASIYGNPVKMGLGIISIAFDMVFIVQHFVLYRKRHHDVETVTDEL